MNASVAAPDLRLLAPAFAGRLAVIIAALVALIARGFLRNPRLAPFIIPLYRRLNRTTRGITTLMASFTAGRRAAQRSGVDSGRGASPTAKGPRGASRERCRAIQSRLPTAEAWLIHELRHEAAGYASQLSHLLNEPGVPELLAAAPAAGRLLRPLCRMLGLPIAARSAVGRERGASSRNESADTPLRGVASQATGVLAFKNPESAVAPSRTDSAHPPPQTPPAGVSEATAAPPAAPPRPPPCPHVRWQWFPATPFSGVARDRCAPSRTESPRAQAKPA